MPSYRCLPNCSLLLKVAVKMNCPVATMKIKAVDISEMHKPVFNALPYLLFRIPDYSNSNCSGKNFKKSELLLQRR